MRLLEALICLVFAQVLLLVPFKWTVPLLGRPTRAITGPALPCNAKERDLALAVSQAVLSVAYRLPWHSSCLVEAIAARLMMGRRKLPSTLQLGIRREGSLELCAHAWLRCGDADVIGTETAGEFRPVVTFSND